MVIHKPKVGIMVATFSFFLYSLCFKHKTGLVCYALYNLQMMSQHCALLHLVRRSISIFIHKNIMQVMRS